MKTVVNVLWVALAGFWLAIGYAIAGVLSIVLIVTIPLAVPAFRMAGYVLWPFGRVVVKAADAGAGSTAGNVVWAVLFGWWLALGHLIGGALLCLTIVGIPPGLVNFKMVPLAFAPYGKRIVPATEARAGGAIIMIPEHGIDPAQVSAPM